MKSEDFRDSARIAMAPDAEFERDIRGRTRLPSETVFFQQGV